MLKRPLIFLLAAFAAASSLFAQDDTTLPISINLPGNSEMQKWIDFGFHYSGYGSPFPGTNPWPAPMPSTDGDSGSATLNKVSNGTGGGPMVSSTSIYFGGTSSSPNVYGGTLSLSDSSPIASLQTIALQIEIGGAFGLDFYNGIMPALNYNGGTQSLAATFSDTLAQAQSGTFEDPDTGTEHPVFITLYGLQWDLRGISQPITSFDITFSAVQHAQIYSIQIDQGDQFVQVIPEPNTYLLLGAGILTVMFIGYRRRRKQFLSASR